eukprot:c16251_g1_i2 orf=273-452(+)
MYRGSQNNHFTCKFSKADISVYCYSRIELLLRNVWICINEENNQVIESIGLTSGNASTA